MSYTRTYPPNGRNFFDGGKNSKFEKSIIKDNESPDCMNVIFNAGAVETRPGYTKINTASVGSFVCDGIYTRKGTNNAETMVAFYGGHGFTLNNTSLVTIASAQSVFTAGVRVGSAQMENHAFFGNGGVVPYKYNGTDWTRHGVYQPTTQTVGVNSNGAGNLLGDYSWKITYVNSASVEGNPSDPFATFVLTSKIGRLTSLPVAPQSWGVSSRRLYRTVTSGATWFRVATISDNTTTTYDDNIADSSLGTAAPTDKGVPPKYSTIIYFQNRLWMNDTDNPGFVWYTDLNEPYTVGSTNFIIVGDQSSDFVTGFAVINNTLAIFCQQNIYLLYHPDTTPANWQILKSRSPFTSKSPYGHYIYNNMIGFPAMQNDKFVGFASLSGEGLSTNTTFLSVGNISSFLKSDPIEPDMFDVQTAYVGNISSIVYKNGIYISLTKASGNTTNNRIYYVDISPDNTDGPKSEPWVPFSGINAAQFVVYAGDLYWGSSTANGYLYKQTDGVYNDDGSAINSYYWTKEFVGYKGEESNEKDFRFSNILVDMPGAYFMGVSFRADSDKGSGTEYNLDLDPGTSLWGTMVWGVDTWGGGAYQSDKKIFMSGMHGKRIQFKFSNKNTANQMFKVHWQNFTYNLKGVR